MQNVGMHNSTTLPNSDALKLGTFKCGVKATFFLFWNNYGN